MSNPYKKIEYKKIKDSEEFVSYITVAPQIMAEGDFNAIILRNDGSGFVLDSDDTLLKKTKEELNELIDGYCGLSSDELIKDIQNKNGTKKMTATKDLSINEQINDRLGYFQKKGMLTPEQEKKYERLQTGIDVDGETLFHQAGKALASSDRSEKLERIASQENDSPKNKKRKRNGLRK